MKKSVMILLAAVVAIGVVTTGILVWRQSKSAKLVNPGGTAVEPTPLAEKLLLWDDPAGFTFQYPRGLTINKHDEDQDNYAHIEFTDSTHPGNVIVWAKDTNATDVTAWVRTEKEFTGKTILDTTLGDQTAKKILITDPVKKMITGTVYDGLLFTVDGLLIDNEYWTKIHDTIVNSFVFKPIAGDASSDSSADYSSEGSVDEEEVVQ